MVVCLRDLDDDVDGDEVMVIGADAWIHVETIVISESV